jgi:hypothetical protein
VWAAQEAPYDYANARRKACTAENKKEHFPDGLTKNGGPLERVSCPPLSFMYPINTHKDDNRAESDKIYSHISLASKLI